ncbi:hypothetical protein DEM27_22980 [Metarhizobium album]|uniref:FAD-binding FR-type domain-containing protein n=2 Tax=Metarhizobium album TaxID=2182425 RepID=A0A2U2DKG5_9HYPH|nr:hypothetical protein DEM27_22980 [Rhizobium album]
MRHRSRSGGDRKFPGAGAWPDRRHHDEENGRPFRRRGGRMLDYGELRLLILSIISERPSHGYELIKSVEDHFGGSYTPSPGVLYPTLSWLDDIGYAVAEASEGNRKSYRITEAGEAYLAANRATVEALRARGGQCGEGGRRGPPLAVAAAMDELKSALRGQLRRPGVSQDAVERIVTILKYAARQIENDDRPTAGTPSNQTHGQENMTAHTAEPESANADTLPRIERIRHDLRRRKLTVLSVVSLTPNMIRITLGGDELDNFTSLSAGDHIKIIVPDGQGGTAMRDYTPRHYDPQNRTLVLDFAVHEAGPATQWALAVKPGDTAEIAGPRGSQVITGPIKSWLLIGDETALPSIGRRIEEMDAGLPVTSVVAVPGAEDEQVFETAASLTSHWLHREEASDAAVFIDRLRDIPLEPGTFVWVAAEGSVTKAVRAYLVEERKHPLAWLRASGYWVKGKADTTEKFGD